MLGEDEACHIFILLLENCPTGSTSSYVTKNQTLPAAAKVVSHFLKVRKAEGSAMTPGD